MESCHCPLQAGHCLAGFSASEPRLLSPWNREMAVFGFHVCLWDQTRVTRLGGSLLCHCDASCTSSNSQKPPLPVLVPFPFRALGSHPASWTVWSTMLFLTKVLLTMMDLVRFCPCAPFSCPMAGTDFPLGTASSSLRLHGPCGIGLDPWLPEGAATRVGWP